MRRYAVLLLLLCVPLLAACGGDDDDEPSPEEARVQLCADLAVLKNDLTAFTNLSGSNSVSNLRRVYEDVQTDWESVQESAQAYDDAIADELESSRNALNDAIEELPDDITIDQGKEQVAPELAAFDATRSEIEVRLECGLVSQATATGAATASGAAETPTVTAETPTVAEEATATPEPEATATVEPTATPEPEPTATEEPTAAPEPTATPEPTVAPEPTAVPGPPPTAGTLVYDADWAVDANGWTFPEGWTIANAALTTTTGGAALAPYQPTTPNYAVEATITVTGGTFTCEQTVGVFARAVQVADPATGDAFPVGMIGSVCPERWELSVVQDAGSARSVLAEGAFAPGSTEHVYRLEVNGGTMRLYIDGAFAGEATDDRFGDAGQVGLYIVGDVQTQVTDFKVYEF